jgi:hypothetical protein
MLSQSPDRALLALADGTLWPGVAYGARGERTGEVVLNTTSPAIRKSSPIPPTTASSW